MRNPYDTIGRIGLLLAVIGALNWLLVGIFEWNLVQWLFTDSGTQTVNSLGERIVYIVVGVGGVIAIPMLAATLSRARGRDVRSDEDYESGRSRSDLREDDTDFYYGAPKEARAEGRSQVAAVTTEDQAARSIPLRKTERVIIRTEEPVTGMSETSASETGTSSGPAFGEPGSTGRDLRYGSVEEADDDLGEERRRAA